MAEENALDKAMEEIQGSVVYRLADRKMDGHDLANMEKEIRDEIYNTLDDSWNAGTVIRAFSDELAKKMIKEDIMTQVDEEIARQEAEPPREPKVIPMMKITDLFGGGITLLGPNQKPEE